MPKKVDLNQQLADKREAIKTKRLRAMDFAQKVKGGNTLTTEERAEWDELNESVAALDLECVDIQRSLEVGLFNPNATDAIGLTEEETREFSLVKLINARANPNSAQATEGAAMELKACAAAEEKMSNGHASMSAQGVFLPAEVYGGNQIHRSMVQHRLAKALGKQVRDLNITVGSAGGFGVATDLQSMIEILRNSMALDAAGVTVIPGLTGDVAFPKHTGAGTGYWISPEGGAPLESQQTLGQITGTPRTMGAYTDFTRQLMHQASFGVENFVRNDLSAVLGLLLDLAGLYGSGVSGQPVGLDNTTNVGSVAHSTNNNPTWTEITEMRSAVNSANANVVSSAASITESNMVGTLMSTAKDAGSGLFLMNSDTDTLMGRPVIESNQVTDGDIWYGHWANLLLLMWGVMDILVDPFTASTTGTTRVVALQSADWIVRYPESFVKAT